LRSAQIVQPNRLETLNLPIPTPAETEVLVQVMASGICGTDIHIFRGEYLGGYPVVPGHEFSGLVAAVGKAVTRFKPGDRVAVEPNIACDNCYNCLHNRQNFCLNWQAVGVTRAGGMAQYVTAPEKVVFDIGELPYEQGAFMEPLSCVLHGLERLESRLADRIALLGAGPIGLLLLQVIRLQGAAQVTVVDKNPARAAFARNFGADICLTDLAALPAEGYDAVIDATGAIPLLRHTLDLARPGGKILWFGVPPAGQPLEIEPFKVFRKGLTILSSFTSVRNSHQALALLQTGLVRVDDLVSHRLPLEQLQRGIETIEQGLEGVKKVLILPN
jgi:D-arabinitol dehydrogenase (NADP+)